MQPMIILDPFAELLRERARHEESLELLEMWMHAAAAVDANGRRTLSRCRLCEQPPPGYNVARFRAACPCRATPSVVGNNRARLMVRIVKNQPRQAAMAIDPPEEENPAESFSLE
jgi:hypothetical protein